MCNVMSGVAVRIFNFQVPTRKSGGAINGAFRNIFEKQEFVLFMCGIPLHKMVLSPPFV